jgi:hypothetical protein
VRAIDVVRAPAGDHAGTKLAAAEPPGAIVSFLRVNAIDRVVDVRSFAEPHFVVEPVRRGRGSLVAARGIAGQADFNALQVADASVAHQFCRVPKLDGRSLLAADLQNAPRGLHRVAERAPFSDGERCGLLQVNILACANGVNADERVPVIGGADDDRVNVFAGEQLVIICVARDAVVGRARFLRVEVVDELFPCRIIGMSCTREIRPTPMAPILMRLLGANWPKTLAGTIVGKPIAAAAAAPVFKKLRRETLRLSFIFRSNTKSSAFKKLRVRVP